MTNEDLETLLMQISAGKREALRALFDGAGPTMAAHLAERGASPFVTEAALVETFGQIWQGEYSIAMTNGQDIMDWLSALALKQVTSVTPTPETPIQMSDDIWHKVAQRAFPENWRNILKRMDLAFIVLGAVVWAVILLAFGR